MPQSKPGIATTIIAPEEDGEGFIELSPNKTLFIKKLTKTPPALPNITKGLQTIDAVFDSFKPACDVGLEREDGSTTRERFSFSAIGDFAPKNLIKKSAFLSSVNFDHDVYMKIAKQLGTNKSLRNVIENAETKKAFVDSLKALVAELDAIEEDK